MRNLKQCDALQPCLKALSDHPDTVILCPTETVYGLLCSFDSESGRNKIYDLKHRPKSKQLAAFFPDVESVKKSGYSLPDAAEKIAEKFCPGPVTIVFPDGKGGTFGFRIPDHPFVLELLRKCGRALASTSANLSGMPAALSVKEALSSLAGEPDIAVDGGDIPVSALASTVIKVNADNTWQILRSGPVTEEQIRKVLEQH